jgi:hypothetical protein
MMRSDHAVLAELIAGEPREFAADLAVDRPSLASAR